MLFDGIDATPAIRRAQLVEALRLPMPAGHTWDFATYLDTDYDEKNKECGTAGCAIGLAHLMWPEAGLLDEGR